MRYLTISLREKTLKTDSRKKTTTFQKWYENTGVNHGEWNKYCKKKKKGKTIIINGRIFRRKVFNANFGGLKHCRTKRNNTSKSLYWASPHETKQSQRGKRIRIRKKRMRSERNQQWLTSICIHRCGIQKKQWQRKTGQDSLFGMEHQSEGKGKAKEMK